MRGVFIYDKRGDMREKKIATSTWIRVMLGGGAKEVWGFLLSNEERGGILVSRVVRRVRS